MATICRWCEERPNVAGGRGFCSAECRYWSKVDATGDCWLWTGEVVDRDRGHDQAYGRHWVGGRRVMAHRYSYELHVGPIPDGHEVDHLCGTPRCVRPDHLEAVTPEEHDRRSRHGGYNAAKTHCPLGHPYDAENTRYRRDGARSCRSCDRAWRYLHLHKENDE